MAVRFVICADGVIRRPRSCMFVPVAFTNITLPRFVRPETYKLVEVVPPAVRFVMFAFVANKLVVVTLVPVAFVKVNVWSAVVPVAVRLPVTKGPVEVPPANWMVLVVVLPAFVTDCRVGVVTTGQFVPSARQMF